MIKTVSMAKEITLTIENRSGGLGKIAKILADHDINLEGIAGYGIEKEARIMLVSDDTLRAVDALKKDGFRNAKENDVVIVDLINKPGAIKAVTSQLASANISINYIYGTLCSAGCPARIVMSTNDIEKVFVILKASIV